MPEIPAPFRPVGPGDHVFLVDGSSFVYRAYYQSMNQDAKYNYRSDGLPTGAVRLFATKLYQFILEGAVGIRPTHLAIIFDKAEKTFRNQLYADYKANRRAAPDELIPQFPLMREAVRAFGLAPIEQAGYEADDIIATYAGEVERAGADALIISSDKDLMQIVTDKVVFYDFESGLKGRPGYRPERKIDIAGVIDYFGVAPARVVDVQALVGDTSDNVPGVPGIGIKTAAQLLAEFGSLDALLERAEEIKQPKRRENIVAHRDQARISRQLVTLDRDAKVDTPLAGSFLPELDPRRLIAFSKAIELFTLTKRVAENSGVDADTVEADPRLRAVGRGVATALPPGATPSSPYGRGKPGVDADTAPSDGETLRNDNAALLADASDLAIGAAETSPPSGEGRAGGNAGAGSGADTGGSVGVGGSAPHSQPLPAAGGGRGDGDDAATQTPDAGTGTRWRAGGDLFRRTDLPAAIGDEPVALSPANAAAEAGAAKAAFSPATVETITTAGRLDAWIADVLRAGHVAIAVMASTADPMQAELCGIGLALAPDRAAYLPLGHRDRADDLLGGGLAAGQLDAAATIAQLKPLLEDPAVLKVGHDLKPAWLLLARHGIKVAPYDDLLLMAYALDAGRAGVGLAFLAERWLGHAPKPLKDLLGGGKSAITFERVAVADAAAYGADAAATAVALWPMLKARLAAEKVTTVYETLERPLVPVLAAMERAGIMVDRQILSRQSHDFAQRMARLEAEINDLAGEPFNIGSTKQIGEVLFGKLGLPGGRKTKTGAWSTDADVLDDLAAQGHALPARILDWRQVSKLKSTYTDALPGYVHPETGRVHTSYALGATSTGRLSSSEPNLQNIPVRTEEGRQIRTAFVAAPGSRLISADYSQIELRVLAHMADIPQLRQAFADGLDIHAMTASEMFGVPVQGMPADVRRRAKAINFGIIYGISAFGLANQLGIPRGEAKDYIDRYFQRFPGIRDYMETTKTFAREHGYVKTLFGRKAHYPAIRAGNVAERAFNERAAINAPIQGTAADIIRRAMIRMPAALADAGLSARMLLQVHDELVFETPEAEVEATLPVVARVMEAAPEPAVRLVVPLQVDARAADNWEAAH